MRIKDIKYGLIVVDKKQFNSDSNEDVEILPEHGMFYKIFAVL